MKKFTVELDKTYSHIITHQNPLPKFPAGELHGSSLNAALSIRRTPYGGKYQLLIKFKHPPLDPMEFIQVVNLVSTDRRFIGHPIDVFLPYLPYSRQDRATEYEVFALKSYMECITQCSSFKDLFTLDVHSDAAIEAAHEIKNISTAKLFAEVIRDANEFTNNKIVIIAPDEGALTRADNVKRLLDWPQSDSCEIAYAQKIRDPKTGEITRTEIPNFPDLDGSNIYIIDDICDGGRTFIELASVIKEDYTPNSLNLCVTHGIFSQGTEQLFKLFDTITTTDSFPHSTPLKGVTVIPIKIKGEA